MADAESALLVPLRSNAHTLLAGAPVAAMRRRLKWASILFDRIYLEAGILHAQAGPTGSASMMRHPQSDEQPLWQSAAQRKAAQSSSFQILVGAEKTPGVPASTMHPVVASETSIDWQATLLPFADETDNCDWVEWVVSQEPQDEAAKLVKDWTWNDDRNEALNAAIPERFVRSTVIKHANRDLALAVTAGLTASIDAVHLQVVEQRFQEDSSWKARGFAVPILFPDVGNASWDTIAELRRQREIQRFRAVLRKVEAEAASEAAGGDLKAAAHHAYDNHLADAVDKVGGISATFTSTTLGFVISSEAGLSTMGIAGPTGALTSAAVGTTAGAVIDVRKIIRRRKSSGWVAVHQLLDDL
jgi:hypothetical protein